jgi:hypothetical protein
MGTPMPDARVPSTIVSLQHRVEVLPARRKAAERVATIRKFNQIVLAAAAQQQRAKAAIACTRQTFGTANVKDAHLAVGRSAKTAARLLKELTDIEAVDKRAIDNAFQDLQTSTARAVSAVEQEWSRQISTITDRFQRIVTVAERAGLRGSAQLRETLEKIQAQTKPRCGERTSVAEYLPQLHETVRTLGLEGEGGKFLARVADGSASAKDLTRPEIVKFLSDYELWPLLTVRFTQ